MAQSNKRSFQFRQFHDHANARIITPEDGFFLHTFYDVCPFSPSGRYLAVTKFPYQGKKPVYGDTAEVCIIDLEEQTIECLYTTKAWSYQLGANIQWSPLSDDYLYANDIIDEKVVGIGIERTNHKITHYSGPKYDIDPSRKYIVGGNLVYMNATQYGYGVPDKGRHPEYVSKKHLTMEGLWKTDLESNQSELLASLDQFKKNDRMMSGQDVVPYCFHSKISPDGKHILQVIRYMKRHPLSKLGLVHPGMLSSKKSSLFVVSADGKDIKQLITPEQWHAKGSYGESANHPNWHPDSHHIVMNFVPKELGYDNMHFVKINIDSGEITLLSKHLGSGHPTVDEGEKHLLTDAYPKQHWVGGSKDTVPIRLIDLKTDEERQLSQVPIKLGTGKRKAKEGGSHFKLDPHPAWDRKYQSICFNAVVDGNRQVVVMDLV